MRWVIKNKKNGLYVVSKKVLSIHSEFARRFNSVKAARSYIHTSDLAKEDYRVIEFYMDQSDYEGSMTVKEITKRIYGVKYFLGNGKRL